MVGRSGAGRTNAGRYDLHPLVQQFALARLAEDRRLEEQVRDRHCEYYLDLLRQREPALESAAQQETIQALTQEIGNVHAAWQWAAERERFALLGPALRCFGLLFDIRGWSQEGIEQLRSTLQTLQSMPEEPEARKVLGLALAQQGLFYFRLGEQRQALALLEESLALLRPFGEPALLVDALVLGGIILHLIGELDRSQATLDEGLACARASGDKWFAAYALFNQGGMAGLYGRYEQGYRQMAEAIAMWRELGDPRFIALGLNFISLATIKLGWLDQAQAYLEESLALSTQIGDRWGRGTAFRFLGLVALARGDAAEAQELIARSLEIFSGFVTGWDVIMSLVHLGQARLATGAQSAARTCFLEALQQALDAGALPLALDALVGLAQVDLATGEARRALESCLFVIDHPAAYHEALEQAGQIQTKAERQLPPSEAAAARAWAGGQALAAIADHVLVSSPDLN